MKKIIVLLVFAGIFSCAFPVYAQTNISSVATTTATCGKKKPVILKLIPAKGMFGDSIIIKGKNFCNQEGKVLFGKVEAEIADWSDKSIIAKVPSIAVAKKWKNVFVKVKSANGKSSNTKTFKVLRALGTETILFKLNSLAAVYNNPPNKTIFTLTNAAHITKIFTYHWNNGSGDTPGTIGLTNTATGVVIGRWNVVGTKSVDSTPGAIWPTTANGPPYLYWTVQPNVDIPAGTYEVVDSNPSTWSYNSDMGNMGCAWVFGTNTASNVTTTTIGSEGGSITAKDGSKFTVPTGALSSSASFTFNEVSNNKYFTKSGQKTYELTGTKQPNTITLVFKVETGLSVDGVGVVAYDPSTFETIKPDFSYNSSTGEITVNLSKSSALNLSKSSTPLISNATTAYDMQKHTHLLTETAKQSLGKYESIKIPMPYYSQYSGTCWAASFSMLEKGYGTKHEIGDWLYALQRGPCDGISLSAFNDAKNVFASFNKNIKSDDVKVSTSITKTGVLNDFIAQLDKGYPLVFRLPAHVVVILGYEKSTDSNGNVTYLFTMHDPKDAANVDTTWYGQYTTLSFNESWNLNPVDWPIWKVLWIEKKPDNMKLQTMVTPNYQNSGEECELSNSQVLGDLKFYIPASSATAKDSTFVFYQSTKDAFAEGSPYKSYRWVTTENKTYGTIPGSQTKDLEIAIRGYNADFLSAEAKVKTEFTVSLVGLDTPLKTLQQETTIKSSIYSQYLLNDAKEKPFKIPVCDIRQPENKVFDYLIKARLINLSSNEEVDSFSMNFKMDGGPSICSITPDSGATGTTVTITGNGFGKTKGTVTFNGITAKVTSWTNTSISTTVPTGTTTGNVVVTANGVKSNRVNFTGTQATVSITISPTSATLLPGGIQTFTSTVTSITNTAVTWSVQEGAAGGAVTSGGVYTAPATEGTYHVIVTSYADKTKSATATVTVKAAPTDIFSCYDYDYDSAGKVCWQSTQASSKDSCKHNVNSIWGNSACPTGYVAICPSSYFGNLYVYDTNWPGAWGGASYQYDCTWFVPIPQVPDPY